MKRFYYISLARHLNVYSIIIILFRCVMEWWKIAFLYRVETNSKEPTTCWRKCRKNTFNVCTVRLPKLKVVFNNWRLFFNHFPLLLVMNFTCLLEKFKRSYLLRLFILKDCSWCEKLNLSSVLTSWVGCICRKTP